MKQTCSEHVCCSTWQILEKYIVRELCEPKIGTLTSARPDRLADD